MRYVSICAWSGLAGAFVESDLVTQAKCSKRPSQPPAAIEVKFLSRTSRTLVEMSGLKVRLIVQHPIMDVTTTYWGQFAAFVRQQKKKRRRSSIAVTARA